MVLGGQITQPPCLQQGITLGHASIVSHTFLAGCRLSGHSAITHTSWSLVPSVPPLMGLLRMSTQMHTGIPICSGASSQDTNTLPSRDSDGSCIEHQSVRRRAVVADSDVVSFTLRSREVKQHQSCEI